MSSSHTYAGRRRQRTIRNIWHTRTNGGQNSRHIHCKRPANILKLLTITSFVSYLHMPPRGGMAMYGPGYRVPLGTISRNMLGRFEPGAPAGRNERGLDVCKAAHK